MNGYTCIKIAFNCPHLHSDSKSLYDFVTSHADEVNAYHTFLFTFTDELILGYGLVTRTSFVERTIPQIHKAAGIYLELIAAILGHGFLFGETHSSDGGMTENNCRLG